MGGRNLKDYPRCPACGYKKWVYRFAVTQLSQWKCGRCGSHFGERNGVPTLVEWNSSQGTTWKEPV